MQCSDCQKVISKKINSEDFTIVNFEQTSLSQISGYLGDHSSLLITIKRNGFEETYNFFVKALPKVPEQRKLALEMNAFFKEESFFVRFCAQLKKHSIGLLEDAVPTCFHTNEEFLVFEDLTSKGYKTLPSRISLGLKCLKSALVTLAKLHASGLILEEIKSVKLIEDFVEEMGRSSYSDKESVRGAIEATKRGTEALIDQSHEATMKISKNFFKQKVFKSFDLRNEFTKPSTKFRNTICHGDPWTNNFMFKIEEEEISCVIIDFQSYRYAPPAQDVMTFLHFVVSKELRNDHTEELLLFYYKELNLNVEKFGFGGVVSKSEFFDSCQYFKEFALTQTVTRFQIVGMSEAVVKELLSKPEKAKSAMFGDKFDFIVMLCQTDPVFRKMNFGAIAELRNFYELGL